MANTTIVEFTTEYMNLITDIRDALQVIANTHTNIDSSINTLATRGSDLGSGIITKPLVDDAGGGLNASQQRALIVSAIKESGRLDELEEEINNPTDLPGD